MPLPHLMTCAARRATTLRLFRETGSGNTASASTRSGGSASSGAMARHMLSKFATTTESTEKRNAMAKVNLPHPGEILQEEFLEPLGVSAYACAKRLGVPLTRITAILAGTRGVTADTALRLGRVF